METLHEQIEALMKEHGIVAFDEAVNYVKESTSPPQCPPNYIWNGTKCVPDIGNHG